LAGAYERLKSPDDTDRVLQKLKETSPTTPVTYLTGATVSVRRRQYDQARAIIAQGLAAVPDDQQLPLQLELVKIYTREGREEEAGREFKSALDTSPDEPQALYYLAAVEMRGGHFDRALPLLERLGKVAPGYPGSREALAAARHAAAAPGASTPRTQAPSSSAPAPGALRLRLLRVTDHDRALEVERRVKAGENFETLTRAFSEDPSAAQGGDLGTVRVADLVEPMRSAAVALRVGDTTPLLKTAKGYVLLKREK
jgi:parvulin-like peptidyl-prolyl isomerase